MMDYQARMDAARAEFEHSQKLIKEAEEREKQREAEAAERQAEVGERVDAQINLRRAAYIEGGGSAEEFDKRRGELRHQLVNESLDARNNDPRIAKPRF